MRGGGDEDVLSSLSLGVGSGGDSISEFPRNEGGLPGPDLVEKLESYPLSYGDGLRNSAIDLERKGVGGGYCVNAPGYEWARSELVWKQSHDGECSYSVPGVGRRWRRLPGK